MLIGHMGARVAGLTVSNLVSVVIPCYNRAPLLRQAIASCALQTYRNLEVIVVDDGSEEDLRLLVDSARDEYGLGERLQYVRQEKRGGGSARNVGLAKASGQFVQFLDSDDLLHPDKITAQLAHLADRPELDMVYCLDEQFAETVGDIRLLWNVPRRADVSDLLDRFLVGDTVWQTGSPLWRRTTLQRVGKWDEDLRCWQDWDFHVAALCAGLRCACSGRVLQYIRRHQGPSTQTLAAMDKHRDYFRAAQKAHTHLSRHGLLDGRRKALLLSYLVNHLLVMGGSHDATVTRLRRDMLAYMNRLAPTAKRRLAIRSVRALAGTPLYGLALKAFQVQAQLQIHALRDVVHADFLPPPPPELVSIGRHR